MSTWSRNSGSRTRPLPVNGLPGTALAVLFVVAALLPLLAELGAGIEPADTFAELATALGLSAAALLLLQFWSSGRYECKRRSKTPSVRQASRSVAPE